MNTEKLNLEDSKLPIFGVSNSFVNNLTVGTLIEKLNFAIENGYITTEHTILVGSNGDTCLLQNLTLPAVMLDNEKDFKQVQMLFTKLQLTDGGMKRWGLRATFLSSYNELDAGQNICITS